LILAAVSFFTCQILDAADETSARWWKGNLHTHSFWSDGDDFPEMIVEWYKGEGYDFLAISDHNVIHDPERWLALGTNEVRHAAAGKYLARFGTNWVEQRGEDPKREVRLKRLAEYRAKFEKPGGFLLMESEEISDKFESLPVHMNAHNIREKIPPQGGKSVLEVMQNNMNAVLEQSKTNGQPVLAHLNHPNFGWGVTAEDLAAVRGERFFEVYNGHPSVHNEGDTNHASTDLIWDVALALRFSSAEAESLYAVAVDDAHHYHKHGVGNSNGGRGWVMVRAQSLTPESLIKAMERGDFYASSGVVLRDVRRLGRKLVVQIQPEPGVKYLTQFIGTPRGFDTKSEPVKGSDGKELVTTRRYSTEVGQVFAEVTGTKASYEFKGNELYVRAKIISSKKKANPSSAGEKETAWTQPVFGRRIR
jgi:hypothetical protein